MKCACQNKANASRRSDPSKTLVLQDKFVKDLKRRFRALISVIKQTIDTNDAFGIKMQAAAEPGSFSFPRSGDKLAAFMDWLKEQETECLLSGGERGIRTIKRIGMVGAIEESWTNIYIESAYQRGIRRARAELRKAGAKIPNFGDTALGLDDVAVAFNQPFHVDRVGVLYTRAFNELKGITNAMDQQISRVLAQGIADGESPVVLAKLLEQTITGKGESLAIKDSLGRYIPAERRTELLARTEIIRAHHQATIQEYKNAGIVDVQVSAEWSTAGDGRVCPICRPLNGKVFSLDKIERMIPAHPLCRCVALPIIEE